MSRDYKQLFSLPEDIYLLNHSVGRPPRTTAAIWSERFLEPWQNNGDAVWTNWLAAVGEFNGALARLLNDYKESFCPQVNLSSALTKVLQSLPREDGRDTIVYSEEDFPSIAFVLQQARTMGYRLKPLPAELDTSHSARWTDAFDDSTALVLVTHVQSNTGRQVPVDEITRAARERGILSVVDVAQSAGCVPIDLQAWSADFVIGSCVKWLCGGPGAGFLWIRKEMLERCEPTDVGWFSHENPFEFDSENFRYAEDARRFWGGTPSVQPYVVAANSIHTLCDIGIDRIRQHNTALTEQLAATLPEGSLVSPRQPHMRGGTLVIRVAEARFDAVCKRLDSNRVLFDTRATGIRLSPHIYNDETELDLVAKCLSE